MGLVCWNPRQADGSPSDAWMDAKERMMDELNELNKLLDPFKISERSFCER